MLKVALHELAQSGQPLLALKLLILQQPRPGDIHNPILLPYRIPEEFFAVQN
jgi:hypothetical protein